MTVTTSPRLVLTVRHTTTMLLLLMPSAHHHSLGWFRERRLTPRARDVNVEGAHLLLQSTRY